MDSLTVQDAVRRSIMTEKSAMDFYRLGARHMKNDRARQTFELLAREEREHARMFHDLYTGDDLSDFDTLMEQEPAAGDWLTDLEKNLFADFDDRKAMELALEKEKALAEHLKKMADRFDDPEVKAVFLKNVESTDAHYQMIEAEYARLMGMVHDTDVDTFVRE
ncbi:rubrerythrin [Geothermobacter ehrlichii]|uniref:Rubrerythrin n=1 Tax=Geothermobacter ehrlichii TaxID=213224 RepID=A0A5D3WHX1_9BACT|nr:ferritin family protein [Geothermobacter ehrlichii]TYO98475.1 rubrerythrin [Geothermobacter ehrlichii]